MLLVKNGPLDMATTAAIRAFANARSFDLPYVPGIDAGEANRFNILPEPYFYDGAAALVGPVRRAFLEDDKFNLTPAIDDRPYFFDFFKWRSLPELAQLRSAAGSVLLYWSYQILAVTLL